MADDEGSSLKLESVLAIVLVSTLLVSSLLIVFVSMGKEPVFSPYELESDVSNQQLTEMRDTFGDAEGGAGYTIANTMSTPMLVNDWKEPHRTLLVIAAPEKPFDQAEASAIHDFVTKKGGKVIMAANSTNAQRVASEFGVKYFDAPAVDPHHYYEVADPATNEPLPDDMRRLWAVASVTDNASEMGQQAQVPCSESMISAGQVSGCRMSVLFHRPTAIQVLDDQVDTKRDINVLAAAGSSAFIASHDMTADNPNNPKLGEGMTGLIIRIDYPVEGVLDETPDGKDQIDVTGSIVFVSDHSVFANHLWSWESADVTGKQQCTSSQYEGRSATCWATDSSGLSQQFGDTDWKGNQMYFRALVRDMMEHDNEQLSTSVTRVNENFNIVFDESRHVSGAITMPFTEAVGAIVLLTSANVLRWLIGLNLFALLGIAIMVVPEKEDWRHTFDLTRFRERPKKVDASQYQARTREAFLSKVRQFHDLTRDEFARNTPAEVMQMVRDPRLVELVSSQRVFSNEELRELMSQIRRWGK